MHDNNTALAQPVLMSGLEVKQGLFEESAEEIGLIKSYDVPIGLCVFKQAHHRCLVASNSPICFLLFLACMRERKRVGDFEDAIEVDAK